MSAVPTADPSGERSRTPASSRARDGASWFWVSLMIGVVVIVASAIAGAVWNSGRDRGVRGPADQGAPDAPRSEKVPPSTGRR
jgi:hypothetical protein